LLRLRRRESAWVGTFRVVRGMDRAQAPENT
jgi:hypothetical protein